MFLRASQCHHSTGLGLQNGRKPTAALLLAVYHFNAHKFDQIIELLLKSEDLLVFDFTGLADVVV